MPSPHKSTLRKVTIQDVADAAGVSRATVSMVLNNSQRISQSTRERVLTKIHELGYIYNQRAASLRTRRSYTVGLIISDISNPFYAELTSGIESHLTDAGYGLLLGTTTDILPKQEQVIVTMRERDADGIIMLPAVGTERQAIDELRQNVPLVLVSRYLASLEVDYVGLDNELGARRAVEHLVSNGHRRIAFIGGHDDSSARRDRLEGYQGMLFKHQIPYDPRLSVTCPVSRQGGYDAIQTLLTQPDPPTAALCYNDVVAFGVMLGLRAAHLEPGRHFAVIGFDNVVEASLWRPPLATIAVNPDMMGREAARLLLKRIENPGSPVEQVIMPSSLIRRDSANAKLLDRA